MNELRNDREAHLALERQPCPPLPRLQAVGAAACYVAGQLFVLVLALLLLLLGLAVAEHQAARKAPACERQPAQLEQPGRCRVVIMAARGRA